ncbi:MAG: serine protease [Solirubrobacterales bacterium]
MTRRGALTIAAVLACLGACLLAAAGAGAQQAEPKAHASIIGGREASIQELPSLAYLEGENAAGGYACSGTVVAPRLILTAGHCVQNIESGEITPAASLAVATGVADLTKIASANISRVAEALVYPQFDPAQLTGDAGLLVLTAPVAAPPIRLAGAGDGALLAAGTQLTIAGWGLTSASAKEGSPVLKLGVSKVQPTNLCRSKSSRYYPFYTAALQLCALDTSRGRVSACHGDSGGPAIAVDAAGAPVELGIVSTGGPNCSRTLPNVFTRVDKVAGWVDRWIAAIEAGGPRPQVKVPQAHKPHLSVPRAKELAGVAFAHDFRRHFTGATEKRIACQRRAKAKVRCRVTWFQGGDDYFGAVTVYYAVVHNTIGWGYSYTISWVDNHCYFYSGHRASCKIHTKTR